MEEQEGREPSLFIIPLMQFFVGLALLIALLNGQRELAVWALLVIGMGVAAKIWSRWSLLSLTCRAAVDKEKVFPGERISLRVEAENAKFLPVWLRMKVPLSAALHPSSRDETLIKESGLLWYQKVGFQWELTAHRRGFYPVGPPDIQAGDLLGFFPRERKTGEEVSVLVYPRLIPLKSFPLPKRDFFGVPGEKSPVQDPVYILGTRDYQHWRPARYIHWKASARHDRLQEKVFEPSEQEKVLILVEVGQFEEKGAEDDFEHALEIAASAAVLLEGRGCAVGIVTNGLIAGGGPSLVPVGRGARHLSAILELLARVKMSRVREVSGMLRRGLILPWGVSCILFSYEKAGVTAVAGEVLRQLKIPVVFVVARHAAPVPEEYQDNGYGYVWTQKDLYIRGAERQ